MPRLNEWMLKVDTSQYKRWNKILYQSGTHTIDLKRRNINLVKSGRVDEVLREEKKLPPSFLSAIKKLEKEIDGKHVVEYSDELLLEIIKLRKLVRLSHKKVKFGENAFLTTVVLLEYKYETVEEAEKVAKQLRMRY